MLRRFQFSLRAMLVVACVVGIVLVPLVAETVWLAWDVFVGVPAPSQALLALLHRTGAMLAVLGFLAAGLAALLVVIKLYRLTGRPSKK